MRTTKASRTTRAAFFTFIVLVAALAAGVFAGSAWSLTLGLSNAPSISSDKADYNPGDTVTLTGYNWAAGESVHIVVNDDQGQT